MSTTPTTDPALRYVCTNVLAHPPMFVAVFYCHHWRDTSPAPDGRTRARCPECGEPCEERAPPTDDA